MKALDLGKPLPPSPEVAIHSHRLDHNPSKLPAHRFVPLDKRVPLTLSASSPLLLSPDQEEDEPRSQESATQGEFGLHSNHNNVTNNPVFSSSPSQPSTFSSSPSTNTPSPGSRSNLFTSQKQPERSRRPPASRSSQGIETLTGPPPALSTQRSFAAEPTRSSSVSTTAWALAQQQLASDSLNELPQASQNTLPTHPRGASKSLDENSLRPKIPPIRAFRSSATRASLDMNGGRTHRFELSEDHGLDHDHTLRALEGFSDDDPTSPRTRTTQSPRRTIEQGMQLRAGEANEDLFLNLAHDDLTRQANIGDGNNNVNQSERRRSRIALASSRQSLPPADLSYQLQSMPRRGSDLAASNPRPRDDHTTQQPERTAYRPFSRDRNTPSALGDISKLRFTPAASRSSPVTSRVNGREPTFDPSYSGRRPSVPDSNTSTPARAHPYRQSNLSISTPRTYHSSPPIARNMELDDNPETLRAAEGTESTTSTTAASTVWDELDDLKSRIRKLELTGKLPLTSGAAISHVSGERPPTATTTNTTLSTSPLRGRGLSISPIDSNGTGPPTGENHPLLHSALAKSKPLLSSEIYKALEAAATDALSIASMMSSVGQPGPISSAQSVVGASNATVTDRQLRRKAESMCRNLTELCIALSDGPQVSATNQAPPLPESREKEVQEGLGELPQRIPNGAGDSLNRVKSSPNRALSRLEARRSSLLATSLLPSPRYNPSESATQSVTPNQTNIGGRRTSLFLRNRRVGPGEIDEDEAQFRAPSRATTEIGRPRNSPREYTSQQQPLQRAPSVISNLPVRRRNVSTASGIGLSPSSTMPNISGRRFFDRSTPEKDTGSVVSRLAEDRGQRLGGIQAYEGRDPGRTGSLADRRPRQQTYEIDSSTAAQSGGYLQ